MYVSTCVPVVRYVCVPVVREKDVRNIAFLMIAMNNFVCLSQQYFPPTIFINLFANNGAG